MDVRVPPVFTVSNFMSADTANDAVIVFDGFVPSASVKVPVSRRNRAMRAFEAIPDTM